MQRIAGTQTGLVLVGIAGGVTELPRTYRHASEAFFNERRECGQGFRALSRIDLPRTQLDR